MAYVRCLHIFKISHILDIMPICHVLQYLSTILAKNKFANFWYILQRRGHILQMIPQKIENADS